MEYFKIENLEHLKVLCENIEQFDCFISLAGGLARSSKYITYNRERDFWQIQHCIDDSEELLDTEELLEANIGKALLKNSLYGRTGQGEEKYKKKEYTVTEIALGVLDAYSQESAEDIFNNSGSSIGHTTSLIVPLDSEEGKFWGNLDVNEVDLMKAKIERLEEELKRAISWSVEDFEHTATYREKQKKVGYGYYDRSRFSYALHEMIRNHDAEIGINWSSIELYLDDLCVDDKPESWHESWQEISFEKAQEIWNEQAVYGFNCFDNSESQLNDVQNEFIPEMVAKWDYLFIEK